MAKKDELVRVTNVTGADILPISYNSEQWKIDKSVIVSRELAEHLVKKGVRHVLNADKTMTIVRELKIEELPENQRTPQGLSAVSQDLDKVMKENTKLKEELEKKNASSKSYR